MVEAPANSLEIPDPVPVRVHEGTRVDLIDHPISII
jgi:hypothetical protein